MKHFLAASLIALLGSAPSTAQNGPELYGFNRLPGNHFYAIIDKTTGSVQSLGAILLTVHGLAFHPDGRLFATDNGHQQLVTIRKYTGGTDSIIGPYNAPGTHIVGLAFHPDGTLYGVNQTDDTLVRTDASTGSVTVIGPFGVGTNSMAGLTWSLDGSTLYAIQYGDGCLYSIDPTTAAPTLIGCGDTDEAFGLATDPVDGQLFAVEFHHPNLPMTLARVDATNGSRTVVGPMLGANQVGDISFDTRDLSESFCTSNLNSTGQPGEITGQGSASLADDDLTLVALSVPNALGLFFFGPTQTQMPFGDGFRCIAGPITRLGPPAPANGQVHVRPVDVPNEIGVLGVRHFQYWFRDPFGGGAGFNTTNGMTIDFLP